MYIRIFISFFLLFVGYLYARINKKERERKRGSCEFVNLFKLFVVFDVQQNC